MIRSPDVDAPTESPYRNPALTVDAVVVHRSARGDFLLLVRRGCEPFAGSHALPGGFVEYGEDPNLAVGREVAEETGLTGLLFKQLGVFGKPGRDPRGHTVSVAYTALVTGTRPQVVGGDDAAAAVWVAVGELPDLAFDHGEIASAGLASLSRR